MVVGLRIAGGSCGWRCWIGPGGPISVEVEPRVSGLVVATGGDALGWAVVSGGGPFGREAVRADLGGAVEVDWTVSGGGTGSWSTVGDGADGRGADGVVAKASTRKSVRLAGRAAVGLLEVAVDRKSRMREGASRVPVATAGGAGGKWLSTATPDSGRNKKGKPGHSKIKNKGAKCGVLLSDEEVRSLGTFLKASG